MYTRCTHCATWFVIGADSCGLCGFPPMGALSLPKLKRQVSPPMGVFA